MGPIMENAVSRSICTGTPTKNVAKTETPVWLKPGDTIEVECPEIGVLRNAVADEA